MYLYIGHCWYLMPHPLGPALPLAIALMDTSCTYCMQAPLLKLQGHLTVKAQSICETDIRLERQPSVTKGWMSVSVCPSFTFIGGTILRYILLFPKESPPRLSPIA